MIKYLFGILITITMSGFAQDTVTVSVYNAVAEQCNEDYLTTAFMYKLDDCKHYRERIIAVSRDLLDKYPNGSKVLVYGTEYDGIYTVRDKMNKRFKKRIDILINSDMEVGFWEDATIILIIK